MMDGEAWARELLRTWREQVPRLPTSMEPSNLDNLSAPVQLVLFLCDAPTASVMFVVHSDREPDGEIRVYGPTSAGDLLEQAERELQRPIWDAQVGDSLLRLDASDPPVLRSLVTSYLVDFFRRIQFRVFAPSGGTSSGGPGKSYLTANSAVWSATSLLPSIPVERIMESIFQNARERSPAIPTTKKTAVERTATAGSDKKTPPIPHSYAGAGAYVFPPLRIGPRPRASLMAQIRGETQPFLDLGVPVVDDKLAGRRLLATHTGFIGIIDEKPQRTVRELNAIALALNLKGHPCHPFRLEELGRFSPATGNGPFSWAGWEMPDVWRMSAASSENRYLSHVQIDIPTFVEVLRDAERLLSSEDADDHALLLEAIAHLSQHEFSPSFLMSWMVIEKRLNAEWKEFLNAHHLDEDRERKLTLPVAWSADTIAEVLSLVGRLSEGAYRDLMKLKKTRNDLLHGRRQASKPDAEFALKVAKERLGYASGST